MMTSECRVAESRTVCKYCIDGYTYNEKKSICEFDPNYIQNCFGQKGKICEICHTNFIPTDNGRACTFLELSPIGNCYFASTATACLYCTPNYELITDPVTRVQTCVPIDPSEQVPRCFIDQAKNICAICKAGYYVNELGKCVLSFLPVSNCLSYDGLGLCNFCDQTSY